MPGRTPHLSREIKARQTARAFLDRLPAAAYITRGRILGELPGGEIEFTMRLPTTDWASAA